MTPEDAMRVAETGARYLTAVSREEYDLALTIALAEQQLDLWDLTPPLVRSLLNAKLLEWQATTSWDVTSALERLSDTWTTCRRCKNLSRRHAYWQPPHEGFIYPEGHMCSGCQEQVWLDSHIVMVGATEVNDATEHE